jgi:protein SCO1
VPPAPPLPHRRLLRSFVISATVLGLVAVSGCGPDDRAALNGLERDTPLDVSAISLPDVTDPAARGMGTVEGGDLRFVAAEGRLLLVSFGFLNCPDICPTTLADVKLALRRLDPADAARIDVAFVTVDPDRDTPDAMAAYLRHFLPTHHAVRTTGPALDDALDAFLASAEVVVADDGSVDVAHTAVLYAVDPTGSVVVEWPFGTSADAIAADLETLLARLDRATKG